jgi:hypothetical protein
MSKVFTVMRWKNKNEARVVELLWWGSSDDPRRLEYEPFEFCVPAGTAKECEEWIREHIPEWAP